MKVKYLFASFAIVVLAAIASPSFAVAQTTGAPAVAQTTGAPYAVIAASSGMTPLEITKCYKCVTNDGGWTKCTQIPCP